MEIKNLDELIEKLLKAKTITILKIQKTLGVGYTLASKIINVLDERGFLLTLNEKEKVAKHGKHTECVRLIKSIIESEKDECSNNYYDENGNIDVSKFDLFFKKALKLVIEKQKVSIAMLQRELVIGYSRAARMVDAMEQLDFISDSTTIPRIVFITQSDYEELFGAFDV